LYDDFNGLEDLSRRGGGADLEYLRSKWNDDIPPEIAASRDRGALAWVSTNAWKGICIVGRSKHLLKWICHEASFAPVSQRFSYSISNTESRTHSGSIWFKHMEKSTEYHCACHQGNHLVTTRPCRTAYIRDVGLFYFRRSAFTRSVFFVDGTTVRLAGYV
jgi:hypothetical protein